MPAREPRPAQLPSMLPLNRFLQNGETALIRDNPEDDLRPGIVLAVAIVMPDRDGVLHQVLRQAGGSDPLSCTLTHSVSVTA